MTLQEAIVGWNTKGVRMGERRAEVLNAMKDEPSLAPSIREEIERLAQTGPRNRTLIDPENSGCVISQERHRTLVAILAAAQEQA